MINWIMKKYGNVKPVVIDGFLYVIIAMGGSVEISLTSDDCYKYMNAYVIWYSKVLVAVFIAGATALKMYRSTSYKEHRDAVDAKDSLNIPDSKQTITQQQTTTVETKTNETEKTISPNA